MLAWIRKRRGAEQRAAERAERLAYLIARSGCEGGTI